MITSYIKRYHNLRSRFQPFHYYPNDTRLNGFNQTWASWNVAAASDMIMLIANDPIVVRCIRTADFGKDCRFLNWQLPKVVPGIQEGGAVVELFANSTCLKQAGLTGLEGILYCV